jgi:hypothetical protein
MLTCVTKMSDNDAANLQPTMDPDGPAARLLV